MSSIKENTLFSNLDESQIDHILRLVKECSFRKGETIIEEHSTGNSMYLLKKGEISIEKDLIPLIEGYQSGPDDKKIIRISDDLNFFFGEMSLFDTALKRTATIKALSDVELLELSDIKFEKILKDRQDIGVILLKNIATKLSRTLENSNIELSKMITAFTLSLKL
ncbi:MAG TPA: cyclic nucleotide-binding domain-containing protein [Clostridiales bacterium]|nr:cyclic nucleotide-binding domain-containing protein [Clostridiales bacterium]